MRDRAGLLHELTSRQFDLLVVGGGITGAGIARDAALRGLSVALIDKGDFASGTSSRSSRLIHGGVRYLEHGHLHLVFEASAERRRLLRIAPHLVRPLAFTWPVYHGQRLPLWKLAAGLSLYDMLALFRNVERHRRLSPEAVLSAEPHLNPRDLRGGVRYFDAATDDARLTLANAIDARRLGAVVANHVAFLEARDATDGASRVLHVQDVLTGDTGEIRARLFVNAAGPWSDAVNERYGASASPRSRVHGSKGTHIAVSRVQIGNRDAVTLLHPKDGRVMFALPSGANTIVGTTDTFTDVSPDDVRASEMDVAYLIEAANAFFPDARLRRADVVSAWAGIRPLLPTSGSSVAASREHAISRPTPHSVAITGGKLTTYRVMAREVVDVAREVLARGAKRGTTANRPLPDSRGAIDRLCESDPALAAPVAPGLPYRMGDIRWAVEHEHAWTLGDLLIRRTHVAFETRDNGRSAARDVASVVAPMFGWDATRKAREVARYDNEVERIFTIER